MSKSIIWLRHVFIVAGLAFAAGAAQAVPMTFDFGATAVGNEQGNPGEMDGTPIGLRFDGTNMVYTDGFSGSGLQVIATGQNQVLGPAPFAYLDGPNGAGRQAGLGVCQALSGNQCSPSNDDNITGNPGFEEQLTLTFNSLVELSGLTFKGENHFGVDAVSDTGSPELDGTDTFLLNGSSITFAEAESGLLSLFGTVFTFGFGGPVPEQFYLGALTADTQQQDVPAPAGLGLLAFGLLGLGAVIRRRRDTD